MNVTTEINNKISQMGGSGSARLEYLSPNRSLNFASGSNNINTAPAQAVTAIPYDVQFNDSVGLMGAENLFFKLKLNIISNSSVFLNSDTQENSYLPVWTFVETGTTNDYDTAVMDFSQETSTNKVNTFDPARVSNDLSNYGRPVVSVTLKNLKTGNQYLDNWLDIRMYDSQNRPIDYDKVYVDIESDLIIGFHARNTKRLPVNAQVEVGQEFLEYNNLTAEQLKQFV